MTTAQITQLVRLKLLESGTDIISDATLLIYANLAHKDVIKKAFPNSSVTTATVTFTAGVGTLPATFGTLYTDAIDSNDNIFPEVSIADFVRKEAGGENCVTIEGGTIKASPTTTASLVIKYYPTYETLTASVNPTIDEYLHEPIIYGTLARAYEDLQDPELSQFYSNKFDTMLDKKLSVLSNYEENAERGGQMFNGINILGNGTSQDPDKW
jgi:hypothetical protein